MSSLRQRAIKEKTKPTGRKLPFIVLNEEDKGIVLDRIDKELVPHMAAAAPLKLIAVGVNSVTKMVERGEADVIIVAMQAAVEDMTWHLVTSAATFDIPICILPATSQELGKLVKVKSASTFAMRKFEINDPRWSVDSEDARIGIQSISKYLKEKCSTRVDDINTQL